MIATLAASLLLSPATVAPTGDRPTAATPLEVYRRGVAFLLTHQGADGSWGSYANTSGFDVLASAPGVPRAYKAATTALCVMALQGPSTTDPKAAESRERGLRFLLDRGLVKRANPWEIANVWADAFVIQALSGAVAEAKQAREAERLKDAIARHLTSLETYETTWGGWNYYDFRIGSRQPAMEPTSFTTASAVVAFFEAQRAGVEVPKKLLERALNVVAKCRKPDGSYLYGTGHRYHPMTMSARDKGSLGRSQVCNMALFRFHKGVTVEHLREGLERLMREHRFIEIGRKRQWPHEAWYATAGYYYYYGHYYAALALEHLPDKARRELAAQLVETIVPHQEAEGSWWDYRMYSYHRAYGTALALLTLERCVEVK